MKLSINEIQTKTFSKKMRGLDPLEVTVFLKKIAHDIQDTLDGYQALKRQFKQTETQLQEYKEREDLLKKTLSNATRMSDRIKTDSDREAKLIISDAQHKAEMITRDAKDSLRKIYQDISELRRVRLQFENNLKAILNSHMTMLDQGRRTITDPIINEDKLRADLKALEPKVTNAPSMSDETGIESEIDFQPMPQMDL